MSYRLQIALEIHVLLVEPKWMNGKVCSGRLQKLLLCLSSCG